ncbi:hypothetical protein B5M09_006075 [Aphanomyces astaci]|uniref:FAD dependent oxidoreductase domain-containing protein n=1 Tax=Aphanomyces astaci TaxID=112090 RepID=A0A3R7WQ17_APHAT|nr:hypothetical protein B5M09_006075 [Aphanomyces astaci]
MVAHVEHGDGVVVDVAVIGGGVVGTAVFRELVLRGYNVTLLEKNANVVHGASCGNSGIACTGYDAPEGSLERRCIRRAMELNPAVYRELGLPSAAVGSLVIAWTAQDLAALPHTVAANHAIDTQVKTLSAAELYALEPHLAAGALGAVFVPGEIVIEPWLIPIAYLHHGLRNGGTLRPVPTDRTKGVFVFRNLHGLVVVGPTAEDQHSREDMTNTPDVVATLRAAASQIVPALAACPVVGTYAADGAHQWVVVGGIRSTGVTASLGIAEYVGQLIGAWFRPRLAGRHVIVPYVVPTFQELAMQFDGTSNSVTIEGLVHQVTHPLTRWGLQKLLKQQQDTSRL